MSFPASLSFDESEPHPAHDGSRPHMLPTSLPVGGTGSTAMREDQPALSFDVLQWEPGHLSRIIRLSNQDMLHNAFASRGRNTSLPHAPVWTPFRCLSWEINGDPNMAVVRLHSGRGPASPAAGGQLVFDQGPGRREATPAPSGAVSAFRQNRPPSQAAENSLLGDGENVDNTIPGRNTVSVAAITRMATQSPKEGERDGDPSRRTDRTVRFADASTLSETAAANGGDGSGATGEGRKRRAIKFRKKDVKNVHSFCFSAPRTIELTDIFAEVTEDHAPDMVAYRFCLFGPVGLIIELHGGLNVFLAFRDASEAEFVQTFLKTRPPLEHSPAHSVATPPVRMRNTPEKKGRDKGGFGLRLRFGKRSDVKSLQRNAALATAAPVRPPSAASSPSLSRHDSRVEGSSIFDQSSQQGSTAASATAQQRVRIPDDGSLLVRPASSKVLAQGLPSFAASLEGALEKVGKYRRLHLRPSRVTRQLMRDGRLVQPELHGNATMAASRGHSGQQSPAALNARSSKPLPRNVHLTRSRMLWWQQLKHKVVNASPSLTTNIADSHVVNLSPSGSTLLWCVAVPRALTTNADGTQKPLNKDLVQIIGPVASNYQHDSTTGKGRPTAFCEVSFLSPAQKESWLRWFELLGAQVQWVAAEEAPAQGQSPEADPQGIAASGAGSRGTQSPGTDTEGGRESSSRPPALTPATAPPSPLTDVAVEMDSDSSPSPMPSAHEATNTQDSERKRDASSRSSDGGESAQESFIGQQKTPPQSVVQGVTFELTPMTPPPALPLQEDDAVSRITAFRPATAEEDSPVHEPQEEARGTPPSSAHSVAPNSPSQLEVDVARFGTTSDGTPVEEEADQPRSKASSFRNSVKTGSDNSQDEEGAVSGLETSPPPRPPSSSPPKQQQQQVLFASAPAVSVEVSFGDSKDRHEEPSVVSVSSASSLYCSPDVLIRYHDSVNDDHQDQQHDVNGDHAEGSIHGGSSAAPHRSETRPPSVTSSPEATSHEHSTPLTEQDGSLSSSLRPPPAALMEYIEGDSPAQQAVAAAISEHLFPPSRGSGGPVPKTLTTAITPTAFLSTTSKQPLGQPPSPSSGRASSVSSDLATPPNEEIPHGALETQAQ